MIEAVKSNSTARTAAPSVDDLTGMAWWNGLTQKDRRHWMRLAGDTGRAIDAWRAFKSATGRDLDPMDVISDLLEELLVGDPRAVAESVVDRLRDAGFEITPADPKRRRRP